MLLEECGLDILLTLRGEDKKVKHTALSRSGMSGRSERYLRTSTIPGHGDIFIQNLTIIHT
jgi:hypothetical protein